MKLLLLIALCAAGLVAAADAQTAPQPLAPAQPAVLDAATLERKVDELFNAHAAVGGFSGSVLLASQGKPLVSKSYGYANAEWQVPNTPQTKFRIGSVTKQFTSMIVMQLREQGKIKLEDSVCLYVEPCPATWKPVTIHHLLTHTSGIPTYTGLPVWRETMMAPKTIEQMIGFFRDLPLQWGPGERYAYNNSGYFLLGVVIEKIAGKKYEQALQEMILTPLGLKDTGYDWPQTIIPRRATGYRGRGAALANAPALDMQQPYAAGSMYSTVEDLLKWDQALYTDTLLPAGAKKIMWTPFLENYAYGWNITGASPATYGHRRMSHGGGIHGFSAHIIRLPDANVTAIVLSNNENASASTPARDLLALYYGRPYVVPVIKMVANVDPAVFEQYVGKYEMSPGSVIIIAREGKSLTAQPPGGGALELFPESETSFFAKQIQLSMTFEKDAAGRVTQVSITQGGVKRLAKRVE
jgi:CubicO group peptidase (beta-lactamase class C family)